jgi:hypothetical protein
LLGVTPETLHSVTGFVNPNTRMLVLMTGTPTPELTSVIVKPQSVHYVCYWDILPDRLHVVGH